jgi:hypothetical protein
MARFRISDDASSPPAHPSASSDPLALIEQARKRILEGERKSESPYVHRAALIDGDRLAKRRFVMRKLHPLLKRRAYA